jgi:CRP-like cAMP-binding protein
LGKKTQAMPNFAPILQNVGKYINLTQSEKDYFTSLLKHRTLKRRQFLVQAFDVCKYESFILKGCLKEYFTDDNGKDHIVRFVTEEYWTSDIESFIKGTPATLNIEALEDCELLQIDYASLELLFQTNPKFERFYRIAFQESYISFQNRIISNLSKSIEDRYQDFAKKYPTLVQRVPQNQIAAYLGVSAEFLSKVKQNLARK